MIHTLLLLGTTKYHIFFCMYQNSPDKKIGDKFEKTHIHTQAEKQRSENMKMYSTHATNVFYFIFLFYSVKFWLSKRDWGEGEKIKRKLKRESTNRGKERIKEKKWGEKWLKHQLKLDEF